MGKIKYGTFNWKNNLVWKYTLIRGYVFGVVHAGLIILVDPSIRPATLGIVLGGLTPLIFIPLLEKYVVKSKHHIVVGDHEDIEKDLKNH